MSGKEDSSLWENNTICPNCGKEIEDIEQYRACETGLSYCSDECATIHVNQTYNEDSEDGDEMVFAKMPQALLSRLAKRKKAFEEETGETLTMDEYVCSQLESYLKEHSEDEE